MASKSALNGKLVVLMGGSGFIGNYVAQALLARGARLRIASRHPAAMSPIAATSMPSLRARMRWSIWWAASRAI